MILACVALLAVRVDAQWKHLGMSHQGNLYQFAGDDNYLFVNTDYGVYSSSDGGNTWTRDEPSDYSLRNRSLCFDRPSELVFLSIDSVVYCKHASEATWRKIAMRDHVTSAAYDRGHFIFATAGGQILTSADGVTFHPGHDAEATQASLFTHVFDVLYTPSGNQGGMSSSDGGLTWRHFGTDYIAGATAILTLGNTLVAAGSYPSASSGSIDPGIYTSEDTGSHWTYHRSPLLADKKIVSLVTDGSSLFVSAYAGSIRYIYSSSDRGVTWVELNSQYFNNNVASHALGYSRGALVVNSFDLGSRPAMRSIDNGHTWIPIADPLANIQVLSFAGDPNKLWIGTNDGLYYSTDGGLTVTRSDKNFRDSVVSMIHIDGNIVYAGTDGGLNVSRDSGVTWTIAPQPLDRLIVTSMIRSGNVLIAGAFEAPTLQSYFYRSTDDGWSWTGKAEAFESIITSLASFQGAIYAGIANVGNSVGFLVRSTDDGNSWQDIPFDDGGNILFQAGRITSLWADQNTLWVSAANNPDLRPLAFGTYYLNSGAKKWEATSGMILDLLSVAAFGPTVIAGTHWYGPHISTNSGATWSTMTGYLDARVNTLYRTGNTLYAGSEHGIVALSLADLAKLWAAPNSPVPHNEISIFPQPANREVTLATNDQVKSLTIFDALGRTTTTLTRNNLAPFHWQVEHVPDGYYYCVGGGEGESRMSAVIIVRH